MGFKSLSIAASIIVSALVASEIQATPTLIYDSGQITGVSGLEFDDGTVWDMMLHDGSFSDFSNTVSAMGISDVYDSAFASDASDVLFNYLSSLEIIPDPSLFLGCDNTDCGINTVYAAGFINGMITDLAFSETVLVGSNQISRIQTNTLINGDWDYETFASWQFTGSVPEPSMFLILGTGLLLFRIATRKSWDQAP